MPGTGKDNSNMLGPDAISNVKPAPDGSSDYAKAAFVSGSEGVSGAPRRVGKSPTPKYLKKR
jgi:hypothetical protein